MTLVSVSFRMINEPSRCRSTMQRQPSGWRVWRQFLGCIVENDEEGKMRRCEDAICFLRAESRRVQPRGPGPEAT